MNLPTSLVSLKKQEKTEILEASFPFTADYCLVFVVDFSFSKQNFDD